MANDLAVELGRREIAEMSCIAGVGGNVRHLLRIAQSGRPIRALDGGPLAWVKNGLAPHGISPARHVLLKQHGVRKRDRYDFDHAAAGGPSCFTATRALTSRAQTMR
jgi:uncharacterized metal-binding protein